MVRWLLLLMLMRVVITLSGLVSVAAFPSVAVVFTGVVMSCVAVAVSSRATRRKVHHLGFQGCLIKTGIIASSSFVGNEVLFAFIVRFFTWLLSVLSLVIVGIVCHDESAGDVNSAVIALHGSRCSVSAAAANKGFLWWRHAGLSSRRTGSLGRPRLSTHFTTQKERLVEKRTGAAAPFFAIVGCHVANTTV